MNLIRPIRKWIRQHFELLFWVGSLIILFFLPVQKTEASLCVFSWLGFGHCPGCGIGHSMHDALHMHFASSFRHHPMGIIGVLIIFNRIKQLVYPINKTYEA